MKFYEKPTAEFVNFESEDILLELQDVGDDPVIGESTGEW